MKDKNTSLNLIVKQLKWQPLSNFVPQATQLLFMIYNFDYVETDVLNFNKKSFINFTYLDINLVNRIGKFAYMLSIFFDTSSASPSVTMSDNRKLTFWGTWYLYSLRIQILRNSSLDTWIHTRVGYLYWGPST